MMLKKHTTALIISQYSHRSFLLGTLSAIYSSIYIVIWLVSSAPTLGTSSTAWEVGLFSAIIRAMGTLFMVGIWTLKTCSNSRNEKLLLCIFENCYHPLIVLSLAVRMVTEVVVGRCSESSSLLEYTTACNEFQEVRSVQPSYLVSLMVIPLLAYFLIRDTRLESIAVSWLISVVTLVFSAAHMKSDGLVYPICSYICASLLIFYDTKRQNDDMIRLVAALQIAAEENERLQEVSRASELRAMIGNVAHDLKTPLTSILSGIECVQEAIARIERELHQQCVTKEVTEQISSMRACLKSMLGSNSFMTMCINRCLDYTKASKGVKLVPKPETVNLQEALDFPISIMRDVQTQLPITLAPVPGEICSHIITDKQWLMENVLCLLSNAVRYSQAGSVEVRVLMKAGSVEKGDDPASASTGLCFEVWDTGIGLPESVMTTLFAPFKQAQRLAGGTGLGLFSLAKRVEALHGQYGVCKRPDGCQGSMFWFSIPYRPDNMSAGAASYTCTDTCGTITAATSIRGLSTPTSHPSLRLGAESTDSCRAYSVLVVDDAPSILKMTTMLLTKKGHTVEKAVNGAQAVDMCNIQVDSGGQSYDVVLMDLQMPVMDGPTAIRRIREAEKKAAEEGRDRVGDLESGGKAWQYLARPHRQLIIALSANSDSDTMQEALDAGADYFMSKPFLYDTFYELMQKGIKPEEG